jgi:uncharacterized protein YfbU (UPF0304 family)
MEIRPVERLILLMLCEIQDHLGIGGSEVDTKFLKSAIFGGHDWAIDWQMSGVAQVEPVEKSVVDEVTEILDLYRALEPSYDKLDPTARAGIEEWWVRFPGFDGNNETEHMSVARFLINEMERWDEFKSHPMNSHSPTLDRAREMVRRYESVRASIGSSRRLLTADEIKNVAAP